MILQSGYFIFMYERDGRFRVQTYIKTLCARHRIQIHNQWKQEEKNAWNMMFTIIERAYMRFD
jgi:hypothetical protein